MSIFETLKKEQGKTNFLSSEEWRYYTANSASLASLPPFEYLIRAATTFDIVRANIVIRSLFGKRKIEKAYEEGLALRKKTPKFDLNGFVEASKAGLPYLEVGTTKVYVAFFPLSVNHIYDRDLGKLGEPPFDALLAHYDALLGDPFDTYGPALFGSLFTRLAPVLETEEGTAFYDYDAERLYFVNLQGRLDAMVCYFDKSIVNPQRTRILERSIPVAEAYYAHDRNAFIRALSEGRLVSSSLLHKIERERLR